MDVNVRLNDRVMQNTGSISFRVTIVCNTPFIKIKKISSLTYLYFGKFLVEIAFKTK